jgi:hypothetical protein
MLEVRESIEGFPKVTVVVPWDCHVAAKIRRMGRVVVELNFALGWTPCDLEILREVPDIVGIVIFTHQPIPLMDPFYSLRGLQVLIIDCASRCTTDWQRFPALRRAAFDWQAGDETLAKHPLIKDLFIERADALAARSLSNLRSLESLRLNAPKFRSIEELADLPALETLEVSVSRRFSMHGVRRFPTLRRLELTNVDIDRIAVDLECMPQLEWLEIANCKPDLPTLRWIERCPRLKELRLERTRVTDGDLSPALRAASLREFRAMNYSHYHPSSTSVADALEARR